MTVTATAEVALGPGVLDSGGSRHRRARLRAVTGNDEERAADFGLLPRPGDVDDLLAGLLDRLGGYQPVTSELVASLTRGDRDRLLLAVRAGLADDEIRLISTCPNPDCGELVEVLLSVGELLADGRDSAPGHVDSVTLSTPDGSFVVRLPRGCDDAAVAQLPVGEQPWEMWRRIVTPNPDGTSPATRAVLAAGLAELITTTGAPDLMRVARCPECAAWLELDPDPVDLLARALRQGASRLLAELHCLAFHYGWAEADALSLPRLRRHRYLDLLRRQVEGRPLEDVWGSPR